MTSIRIVPAADLERETGFNKDLLRKWRSRYGFPTQVCTEDGEQGYPQEQVARLRQIRRLLDAGFRPGQIVGKPAEELDNLTQALLGAGDNPLWSPSTRHALELLKRHDLQGLVGFLALERKRQTLSEFIQRTVAPLATGLGEAWAQGQIEVYHEHLCTGILMRQLFAQIGTAVPKAGYPRIVFATAPEEFHVLGLLMAQAVLADLGADCINVGPHIPVGDLGMAVDACEVDIVALSFSFSYPKSRIQPLLMQLRAQLPAAVEIWAGGAGVVALKQPLEGVRIFTDLDQAATALRDRLGTSQI